MTLGTPNYFPPEQALVEDTLDCRTDMYALGATLYHLSTGKVPFANLSPEEVASQQVHGQIPSPKKQNPKLSYGYCALVERLMAKDQQHRYDGWDDVMADIMHVRDGQMIRSPLAANIRSTVEHTPLPANLGKQGKKIVRKRGSPPVRQSPKPAGNIQRARVSVNADALSRTRARHLQEHPTNIWPSVLIVAGLAAWLYGYTFLV